MTEAERALLLKVAKWAAALEEGCAAGLQTPVPVLPGWRDLIAVVERGAEPNSAAHDR